MKGILITGWNLVSVPSLIVRGGVHYEEGVLVAMIQPGWSFEETIRIVNEETTHVFTIAARIESDLSPFVGRDYENEVMEWLWPYLEE
jgi:hypothetical protein